MFNNMKKEYIKPTCEVVEIKIQSFLINISNTKAEGLDDKKLDYYPDGDDPEDSW